MNWATRSNTAVQNDLFAGLTPVRFISSQKIFFFLLSFLNSSFSLLSLFFSFFFFTLHQNSGYRFTSSDTFSGTFTDIGPIDETSASHCPFPLCPEQFEYVQGIDRCVYQPTSVGTAIYQPVYQNLIECLESSSNVRNTDGLSLVYVYFSRKERKERKKKKQKERKRKRKKKKEKREKKGGERHERIKEMKEMKE